MAELRLTLHLLPESFGVCRLDPGNPFPDWACKGDLFSITRTVDEWSVACLESLIPSNLQAEKSWRILKVVGPLDFSLTGIIAAISAVLAARQISIFAISTYDTDYILVKEKNIEHAVESLRQAGYVI